VQLKFDNFNFQVKSENNKNFIYDVVRKKFVRLTPEEWVRQHTIHQLIKNGFSANRLSVERTLPLSKKRYDAVYYNRDGRPWMLIECKASSVKINEQTLNQIASYVQLEDVPFVLLTNGIVHYTIKRENKIVEVIQDFPNFSNVSD
jgi:hypothetical protein